MKLIIQIPCFNEEKSLPDTLAALPRQIDGVDQIETMVIDDGSSDRTLDVARQHGVNHVIPLKPHQGLARAFKAGLDAAVEAGADIIVNTDADGQYKGEDILRLVRPIIEKKADIVIGNRDIENIRQFSFLKKKLQRVGSAVVRYLAGSTIPDVTTGFRAYSRRAALHLNIISDYTYTLESIIQLEKKNLAVENITITTNDVHRKSRLFSSIPQYIRRSMVTIVRMYSMYNPLKFFLWIGGAISLAGTLIGCRFLFYYMMGSGEGRVQSLILAAVLLIMGFQTAIIGLLSDLIAANRRLIEETLLKVREMKSQQNGSSVR